MHFSENWKPYKKSSESRGDHWYRMIYNFDPNFMSHWQFYVRTFFHHCLFVLCAYMCVQYLSHKTECTYMLCQCVANVNSYYGTTTVNIGINKIQRERGIPSRYEKIPRALSFDAYVGVTCCCRVLHNTPNNNFSLCNSFLLFWYYCVWHTIWVVMAHVFDPWYFNYCRIKRYGSKIDFACLLLLLLLPIPSQSIISPILWSHFFFVEFPSEYTNRYEHLQKLNAIWQSEDDTRQ